MPSTLGNYRTLGHWEDNTRTMASSQSSKYFSRYLAAGMSYAFARTMVRTNDAMMYDKAFSKDENARKMLFTERMFAAVGASIVGAYISPLYIACDLCALEKSFVSRGNQTQSDNRPFYTVADAIFDLRY